MRRQSQRTVVSIIVTVACACLAVLFCSAPLLAATKRIDTIICREELSSTRREVLAAKLSTITGLSVTFDANGVLQILSSETRGGSRTARALLRKALDGTRVLILEDASDRQDVVFSRVVPARLKHHVSELPETFVVLIDFADFEHLLGDETALRAFDVGWAFLHELDHVVNDYPDSTSPAETGECEAHINLMRSELNLPTRTDYFFKLFPGTDRSEFRTRFVRLAFDQKDLVTRKHHRYWVMWDGAIVGGLDPQIAKVR